MKRESCDDVISRQAVIEYIKGSEAELGHGSENELVCHDIKELPPVTPQPKMGYWIRGKYTEDDIRYNDSSYKCSECGNVVNFKENFCPRCGAKMIEPQESEE